MTTGSTTVRSGSAHYGVPLTRSTRVQLPPHPDSCEFEDLTGWLRQHADERLAVDLFSGAGGLSRGLMDAGWTTAVAVDNDERALQTHHANFPGASVMLDLGSSDDRDRLVNALEGAKIDLVAGGPPCQPFSRAGRSKIRSLVERSGRDPHDRRKELWAAYMDVVSRVRPRAVIMENVPDMGLADDFRVLRVIESRLESLGYASDFRIVEAWRYGVPQHRRRLILLARRDADRFEWPADLAETKLGHAIGDLPVLNVEPLNPIGAAEMDYVSAAEGSFQVRMRKGAGQVLHDHHTRRVRPDDYEVFASMTSKTLYSDIDESKRRYSAETFRDKYKRLDADGFSRTITAHIAKDGYWYIHPEQHRTLTVREAARIQTFPDTFRFAGTRSDAFKQIGNAVPPLLGEAVARAVLPRDDDAALEGRPHWGLVRAELDRWIERQRAHELHRYFLPGPGISATQHAIVATIGLGGPQSGWLSAIKAGFGPLTPERFVRIIEQAGPMSTRVARRLETLVGRDDVIQGGGGHLADVAGWTSAESTFFSVLRGSDALLSGAAAQRVAARLHGDDPNETINRQTEGRARIARMVGAGKGASARMAAARLLGTTVCTPAPRCGECPLAKLCLSASRT